MCVCVSVSVSVSVFCVGKRNGINKHMQTHQHAQQRAQVRLPLWIRIVQRDGQLL